jgi:hypothetical protein
MEAASIRRASYIISASMRTFSLCAIFATALCLRVQAEPFKIFVAGDGRADYPDASDPAHALSPRPEDRNGINECTIVDISAAVVKEKPDLFLWTGDIVNVNYMTGSGPIEKSKFFKDGLDAWFKAMEPVYQNHIKVLPTRGNHEVVWYDEKHNPHPLDDAEKIWKNAFSGGHALPQETVFDNNQLSFYYVQGPVLLIGLDQYEKDYDDHHVSQQWLNDVLNKNKKPFIFAFGHEAAFATSTNHPASDTLAAHREERDKMCKALGDAGAQLYLCGHDHFYDRMLATWSKGDCKIRQVAAGTAGAPFYFKTDYPCENDWTLKQERHFDSVYGYVLISLDGNTATIEFKGRNLCGYETRDSFSYTVNAP